MISFVKRMQAFEWRDGLSVSLGHGFPSVWVEAANNVHLLLCSIRSQVFGTDAFTGLGLSLADKRLIVVKSTQHFLAGLRLHRLQGPRPELLAAGGESARRLSRRERGARLQ